MAEWPYKYISFTVIYSKNYIIKMGIFRVPPRVPGVREGPSSDSTLPGSGEACGGVYSPQDRYGRWIFTAIAAGQPGSHRRSPCPGEISSDLSPDVPLDGSPHGVVERVDQHARVVAHTGVEPARFFPVGVVGRSRVGELIKRRPLGMEDDDAPEPWPPLSSLDQRLEERSGRLVESLVVLADLPLRRGGGVRDNR